jgi:hypothetical protein
MQIGALPTPNYNPKSDQEAKYFNFIAKNNVKEIDEMLNPTPANYTQSSLKDIFTKKR